MSKKVAEQDQFQIRLPAGMRDRIRAVAEANNRSMNAEIVATLEEKYPASLPFVIVNVDDAVEMVRKKAAGGKMDETALALLQYLEETKRRQDEYLEAHGSLPTTNQFSFGPQSEVKRK